MYCVYCGREKEDVSDEHVVPQALGGAVDTHNPFLLEVCSGCNTTCGRYVDGPFVKSFFINSDRSNYARQYANLVRGDVVPLSYMGTLKVDEAVPGKICEHFLGPSGDLIYHFHDPYPALTFGSGYMDAPYQLRPEQYDAGFVMAFIRATNPAWHLTILRSIRSSFKSRTTIYLLNVSGAPQHGFSDIPGELSSVAEKVREWAAKQHDLNQTFPIDVGDRFLAKLALGFGGLLLDGAFSKSSDAVLLRQFLWSKTPEERTSLLVHGTGFIDPKDHSLRDLLGWPPGHVFIIQPISANVLGLTVILYGNHQANIQMTSNAVHWNGRIDKEGSVFVVCPSLRRAVGPLPLAAYIAAKQGYPSSNMDLTDMINAVNQRPPQPPFDL